MIKEMFAKADKADKKHGWTAALPWILGCCGLMFVQNNGLYPVLIDMLKGVGGEVFNSIMQTGQLHVDPTSLTTLGNIAKLLVPFFFLGTALAGMPVWSIIGFAREVKDLHKTIGIEKARKQELDNLPDKKKERLNDRGIHYYLSRDNELLHLYRGSDLQGRLYVSEGIESIGEHAFDDFSVYDILNGKPRLKENISAIVLPSTIKNLNIDNIPRGTSLIFTDARLKSILRNKENYLKSKEIKIEGRLFSDVLKECKTLEHQKKDDEVSSILEFSDIQRINNAFSKINDPSLKIELMDRFHALILSGDMSIPDFNMLLTEVDFEPKDRYLGESVIEKIYGSVQKAYDEFETKYYEAENEWIQDVAEDVKRIQKHKPVIGHERKATQNVLKTIEFVESVAKEQSAFLTDKCQKLEKPNNIIEMSDPNHQDREDREELITGPSKRIDVPKPKQKDSLPEKDSRPGHPETMGR